MVALDETQYSIQEESNSITIKKQVSAEEFEKSKKVKKTKKKDEKVSLSKEKSSDESKITIEKQKPKETSPASPVKLSEESVEVTIEKPVKTTKESDANDVTEFKFKRGRSSEAPVESEFTLKQTEPMPSQAE